MSNFIKPKPIKGETLEEYGQRIIQANCKHTKGYITNTTDGPSKCIECGKPWFECEKEIRENNEK